MLRKLLVLPVVLASLLLAADPAPAQISHPAATPASTQTPMWYAVSICSNASPNLNQCPNGPSPVLIGPYLTAAACYEVVDAMWALPSIFAKPPRTLSDCFQQ